MKKRGANKQSRILQFFRSISVEYFSNNSRLVTQNSLFIFFYSNKLLEHYGGGGLLNEKK